MYQISDEPSPGPLSAFAVRPLWPFVAVMFGGVWLSWSWFALNAIAVGSPTKRKEWIWITGGLFGCAVLLLGLSVIEKAELVPETFMKYLGLVLVVWKLSVTYVLFTLQSHTIELYEYYGGPVRNGLVMVIASLFVSPMVLGALPDFARDILS